MAGTGATCDAVSRSRLPSPRVWRGAKTGAQIRRPAAGSAALRSKPGIWDPLIGLASHGALGSRWTLHLTGDGGGFGAGADVDLFGSMRADVRLAGPVGLTFGYSILYLKLSDTLLQRTLQVKQTLHGPIVGLGFYF